MNRAKNLLLTVVAALVTLALLAAASLGLRHISRNALRNASYTFDIHNVDEPFREAEISSGPCELFLFPADGDAVSVYYSGAKGIDAVVETRDGVLRVDWTDQRTMVQRLLSRVRSSGYGYTCISVYLPREGVAALRAESVSGDINVTDGIAAGDIALSSVSGRIWIDSAAARTVAAQTVSGDISLHGDTGGSVDLSTTSGDIFATLPEPRDFAVSSVSGSVSTPAPDPAAAPFRAESVSGDILIWTAE